MPHQCTNCARRFDDGSKEMLSGCPNCGGTKFQFLPGGDASSPAGEPPEPPEPPEPTEPPARPEPNTSAVARRVGRATAKLRDVVGDGRDVVGNDRDIVEDGRSHGQGEADPSSGADRGTDDGASSSGPDDPPGESAEPPRTDAAVLEDGADALGSEPDAVTGREDGAQSSARSEMVTADELPDGARSAGSRPGDVGSSPGDADGSGRRTAESDGSTTGRGVDAESGGQVVDTPSEDRPDLAELRDELNDQFEGIRISEPGQYELNLMELYEREETIIALQENGRYVIEPPESWRGD